MIEPVKSLSTTLQEESTRIDMDRQDRQQDAVNDSLCLITFKANTQLNALLRVEQLTSYIICLVTL